MQSKLSKFHISLFQLVQEGNSMVDGNTSIRRKHLKHVQRKLQYRLP
jgi:hypothetical protein